MSFPFDCQQVAAYHESTLEHMYDLTSLIESHFFDGVQSILDIGCGDGKITAYIAKLFPAISIIGCDVSESMIDFASKKFPSEEYPNLTFIQKNASSLGFQAHFDRVLSFNCLHWIKDQSAAFIEIEKCLKPSGKAFLIAAPKSVDDTLQKCCRQLILSWKWFFAFVNFKPVHSFHTKHEYEELIEKSRLLAEKIEERKKTIVFKDRNALELFLKAVLTPLYHLQESKRPDFLDGLLMKLQKNGSVDTEGSVHVSISQIEMLISKPHKS